MECRLGAVREIIGADLDHVGEVTVFFVAGRGVDVGIRRSFVQEGDGL